MPRNKTFRLVASARTTGNRKGEVTIYSAIDTWRWDENDPTVTSNDFIKDLNALDVDEITVRINSPGGVVSEAVAIRTALMKHPATKRIDIEGCCDSAATLIACLPGATVRMAKGGEYMIHRCSGGVYGNADKMLSAYHSAMQTDKSMAAIYAERTGKTEEECLALMTAETWYGADEAIEAGFVDEIITGADDQDDFELAACAVSQEELALMQACYEHVPEHVILKSDNAFLHNNAEPSPSGENDLVSYGSSAVAADSPTENTGEGVNHMELRDATAEQLRQENPTLAETIAQQAVTAERERMQRIDKLTPKGAKFADMAKKAKAEGTSVEDYLVQVIEAQEKAGDEYLQARANETAPVANVGAGDPADHDDPEETIKSAAKDIAELAKEVSFDATAMI